MKYINQITTTFILVFFILGCKKENENPQLASVNVVNAAVNAGTIKVNYYGQPIKWSAYTTQIAFGANGAYSLPVGSAPLVIVPVSDTLTPIYNNNLNLAVGDVYSLYLIGQAAPYENLFVKESIPSYNFADSLTGVRFINLSPNAPAVNVTLSTTTTVNEFANVAYKQSSNFKTYPAKIANPSYIFQVRDAATNAVLASYTYTIATAPSGRFWNITLVLKGLVGGTGTNAIGIQRVNNY